MLFPKFHLLLALTSSCRVALSQQQQPLQQEIAKSKTYIDDELENYVRQVLLVHHVPGMSLAIVDGENIYTTV